MFIYTMCRLDGTSYFYTIDEETVLYTQFRELLEEDVVFLNENHINEDCDLSSWCSFYNKDVVILLEILPTSEVSVYWEREDINEYLGGEEPDDDDEYIILNDVKYKRVDE